MKATICRLLVFSSALVLSSTAFGQQERVDMPFQVECTFSGKTSFHAKTYRGKRAKYPLQQNRWWTVVSDSNSFLVDNVLVKGISVTSYDYRSEGSKSTLQVSTVADGISRVSTIYGANPNKTATLALYERDGLALTVSCTLK